jgi:hypothetical protein
VGPGVAPGNVVVGGAHLGSRSMGGEGGSSSVFRGGSGIRLPEGGQQDHAAMGEREEGEKTVR